MRTNQLPIILSSLIAALVPGVASAASRPVVVELFTSEGCSSCPPADAYLTELATRRDVLPLAFHVTYWNSLGWRDPYSFDAATSRQADYAGKLGGGSYTPEMVVDGRRGLVGSERGSVASAIAASKGEASDSAPVTLSRSAAGIKIAIGAGRGQGRILLIGFDRQHQTQVGRGENSGRTLTESNIVRSMRVIGTYDGAPIQVSEGAGAGQDAAVIVQSRDGSIIGAARL